MKIGFFNTNVDDSFYSLEMQNNRIIVCPIEFTLNFPKIREKIYGSIIVDPIESSSNFRNFKNQEKIYRGIKIGPIEFPSSNFLKIRRKSTELEALVDAVFIIIITASSCLLY